MSLAVIPSVIVQIKPGDKSPLEVFVTAQSRDQAHITNREQKH